MSINWYPGHMHKARKEIIQVLDNIDLLIEIVDARLPYSSQNPVIARWRDEKPTLVIFSKTDLADPEATQKWQEHLEQQANIKTLAYHMGDKSKLKQISDLCLKLMGNRDTSGMNQIQAMILGIPNVGKSTLINGLTGKSIAKTGDEPAVTKHQQKYVLNEHITLHDTPGILWPKIDNPNSGYRLAIIGSIKNTAVDYEDIGFYAIEYMMKAYPERLVERYQLDELPRTEIECMEAIGIKRNARQSGGRVNLHKVSEILIHDIRSGQLGGITLETPDMIANELIEVERIQAEKEAKKAAKKNKRQRNTKQNN